MIPSHSYVTLQSFMVNELNLGKTDLMVFAIIYGFSQDGQSMYTGSQKYLADWTQTSVRTVQRSLAALKDRGLIEETTNHAHGLTFKSYKASSKALAMAAEDRTRQNVVGYDTGDAPHDKLSPTDTTNCRLPHDKLSPNNNRDNYRDNNKPPIVPLERGEADGCDPIRDVIDHLNARSGKSFKADTKATRGMVHARMEEGYGVDVIKRVIDLKVGQWSKSPKMRAFIRPSTLFSKTNFENYVNELGPIADYSKYDGVVDEVIGGGL